VLFILTNIVESPRAGSRCFSRRTIWPAVAGFSAPVDGLRTSLRLFPEWELFRLDVDVPTLLDGKA